MCFHHDGFNLVPIGFLNWHLRCIWPFVSIVIDFSLRESRYFDSHLRLIWARASASLKPTEEVGIAIENDCKLKEALEGEWSRILEYREEDVTGYEMSIKF